MFRLMDILKDDAVVELLGIVHKTIFPYFCYYSNKDSLINYDGF